MKPSPEQMAVIDDLLARYCEVLDLRDFARWAELFAEQCAYAVYAADDAERGLPLAYMLDDNRARVLDRVKFIDEVWRGTFAPYRTRHVMQRTTVTTIGPELYNVKANVLVAYTQTDGVSGLLMSGRYEDRIRTGDSGATFVEKRVYLDGIPPRYLVYPL